VARLFVIDQSLANVGGHHYDYVNCVVKAASHDRHEIFVATNRRFRATASSSDPASLGQNAKVLPAFRNTTYQKVSWLAGLRHLKRAEYPAASKKETSKLRLLSPTALLAKRRASRFRKQRRKLIAQFACDCSRFFTGAPYGEFRRGDQIFLTTVSELELMGLAIFLTSCPSSRRATWHLQFHFNLFAGRPNEFSAQNETQRKVRGCFLAALSRIPDHDVRFYCTSDELVEQYSGLKVAEFSRLSYPINERFAPSRTIRKGAKVAPAASTILSFDQRSNPITEDFGEAECCSEESLDLNNPARMIVPGELRREKGSSNHLQGVVNDLWEDYLSVGRLQVAVQRPARRLIRGEKLDLQLPGANMVGGQPVVDYLRHPLPEQEYCDFIRGSDFGLLLHQRDAYFSRRAGVLGELMSCGKPVVVPAGCWLAHQIQEGIYHHVGQVRRRLGEGRVLDLRALEFDSANAPLSGGVASFDRHRHPFLASTEKTECENIAIVSFNWQHPKKSRGTDARVRCTEFGSDGSETSSLQVLGHRTSFGKCQAIFRIGRGGNKVRFQFENAFEDSTASIRDISVELFSVEDADEVPTGFNGVIYSDAEAIAPAVAEVVEHLDHYRKNAQTFASQWWQAHDPQRTIDSLFDSTVLRKVA
jgi:hypothetical protein